MAFATGGTATLGETLGDGRVFNCEGMAESSRVAPDDEAATLEDGRAVASIDVVTAHSDSPRREFPPPMGSEISRADETAREGGERETPSLVESVETRESDFCEDVLPVVRDGDGGHAAACIVLETCSA